MRTSLYPMDGLSEGKLGERFESVHSILMDVLLNCNIHCGLLDGRAGVATSVFARNPKFRFKPFNGESVGTTAVGRRCDTYVRRSLGRWFVDGREASQPHTDQPSQCLLEETTGCAGLVAYKDEEMGRGVYTTSPVLPGATIARSHLVIDARKALAMPAFCPPLKTGEGPDPYAVLGFFLYKLLFFDLKEVEEKEHQALSLYRDVLLADTSSSVLDWTDSQVSLLRGSHLHTMATDMRQTGDATIAIMNGWLDSCESGLRSTHVGDERTTKLRRCLDILLTRLVRLDDGNVALAPGLDLFNHECSSKTYIQGTQKGVRVVNRDGFLQGSQQVFISYGNKTNGELLLSYGFVPDQNPHDGVLVPLDDGTVVRLCVDGGVRVSETERSIDKERLRAELRQRVRRQLEVYRESENERARARSETDAHDLVDKVMSFEAKLLSKALMSGL